MRSFKPVIAAVLFNVAFIPAAMADGHLSKSEVKAQAVQMCHAEAEKKYGVDSIVYSDDKAKISRDTSRAKWNKSLKGAMVKMKIKPKSKRAYKYNCLVKTDKTITFFKA